MGGYEQLVRGEPFRGKFRKSFEQPVPFVPGKPDKVEFQLLDVFQTFRRGHRIMVQVQSSWFPLVDRNPQKFMKIDEAQPSDFKKLPKGFTAQQSCPPVSRWKCSRKRPRVRKSEDVQAGLRRPEAR